MILPKCCPECSDYDRQIDESIERDISWWQETKEREAEPMEFEEDEI